MIRQYNLQTKLLAITTAYGAGMLSAMKHIKDTLNREYRASLTSDHHIHCVCRIISHTVIDAAGLNKSEVEQVREFLKIARRSTAMRQKSARLNIMRGEAEKFCEISSLDVETRWNSMFTMI